MIPKHIERKFTQNLFTIERDVYRDGILVTTYSSGGKIPCFTDDCKKTWNSHGEINIVQYTLTQKTE